LQHAQAAATAAKETAEGLWQERTTAQILQAQFVAALVDRITALAQDPLSPSPPATAFPFAYAEVERAVDLLAQKLRQGCGWGELSWLAGHAPFDLATALTHLTGCLQDQSARLHKASQAAQLDYSAKLLHKIRLDLADLTDQTQQTATFAADLSQAVHAYAKTPPLPRLFAVTQSRPNGIAPVSEPGVQRSPVLTALTWQGDQAASRAA
jgi:murein L,D-transpeptidase YcbB/YkuD